LDILDENRGDAVSGQVLVVDDDRGARTLHRAILSKQFGVVTVPSGEEALEICRQRLPDLVLLDIEMPGLGGLETCRRLRELTDVPVIFVTGHESIEEHLMAYDVGGNDIIIKPVQSEILLRKVMLAIQHHRKAANLVEEKESLQRMAMGFLSSMGQNGTLLNFMRASISCRSHRELAEKLLEATQDLGLQCSVSIRHESGSTVASYMGRPSALECSILEQSPMMGRIFQFKRRLAVNYKRVSLIVGNMPDEETESELAGQLRDNIAILAETTEALCENVDMRIESRERAEQLQVALGGAVASVESLRKQYAMTLNDTGVLLQQIVDDVERMFSWLDANQEQERSISQIVQRSTRRIVEMLAERGDFDKQFDQVLDALRGGSHQNEVELF
jgi:DNA-binding response OmpR family regulator